MTSFFFFFQAEDGIRDVAVTGVQTCALPISFSLPAGQTGPPIFLGADWIVYHVLEREQVKTEDMDKLRKEVEPQVLQSKRQLAYEAFRTALEQRMRREGKLRSLPGALKRFGSANE